MPKQSKKLNSLNQINAKVGGSELTSLDQVWGFNEISRYGTTNEETYKTRVMDMTRADLENHARGVGCMVLESSERLRDALLRQFRAYILSLRKPAPIAQSTNKVSAEIQKILNEGR
jgi:hypothetical protein